MGAVSNRSSRGFVVASVVGITGTSEQSLFDFRGKRSKEKCINGLRSNWSRYAAIAGNAHMASLVQCGKSVPILGQGVPKHCGSTRGRTWNGREQTHWTHRGLGTLERCSVHGAKVPVLLYGVVSFRLVDSLLGQIPLLIVLPIDGVYGGAVAWIVNSFAWWLDHFDSGCVPLFVVALIARGEVAVFWRLDKFLARPYFLGRQVPLLVFLIVAAFRFEWKRLRNLDRIWLWKRRQLPFLEIRIVRAFCFERNVLL